MFKSWRVIFSVDIILRVIADIVMVNFCLFSAFIVWFLWEIFIKDVTSDIPQLFYVLSHDYIRTFPLLTIICIFVFSLSGFYTHSRSYYNRFKAVIVTQAVIITYLIFFTLAFFTPIHLKTPKSIFIVAWVFTLILLLFSRLWSVIWKKMALKSNGVVHEIDQREKSKTVLVIGGAGYIGSALLPKLLNNGYTVRLLDIFMYSEKPIEKYLNHPCLQIIKVDFRQVDKVVEAVKGVGSVIHLGAIVGDPACSLSEDLTVEVNLMATRMIAEVCKGFGVERFIFASTCSVYGASDQILDERSRLNPISLYAKSKIASEKVLLNLADDSFNPIILRFGTVFGVSGRIRFDLVVNLLTAKSLIDKKITVHGGDQWRPFVHVDDAAAAILAAIKVPISVAGGEIFNVGDNSLNFTISQIGHMISKQVPEAELVEMGEDKDKRNYKVDFSKINRRLNFKARWSLEQGINQIIEAIASNQITDYSQSEFSNFKVLQDTLDVFIVSRYIDGVRDLL